jgi:malate dehydrogenase (oxaloacetate-decarboxylating)
VNNSLGFPAIFRGVIDVAAKTITDEMCIAAAEELARFKEGDGLTEDAILPTMDDREVFPREAAAVGLKAIEQGVARKIMTKDELVKTQLNYQQGAKNQNADGARSHRGCRLTGETNGMAES